MAEQGYKDSQLKAQISWPLPTLYLIGRPKYSIQPEGEWYSMQTSKQNTHTTNQPVWIIIVSIALLYIAHTVGMLHTKKGMAH